MARTNNSSQHRDGTSQSRSVFGAATSLLIFLLVGWWVVNRSQGGGNSPEVINYHYMLLDGWSVAFVVLMLALWWLKPKPSVAVSIVLTAIAAYGVIALALILAPSQFPDNGYWGDQKFRIAMIQHFMTHGTLTDYYYRDLPVFYPPTYYYVLALIGKLTGHPAYKMAQVGLGLLFVVAPFLLYWLWRKLLSRTAALVVAASVMLVDIGGSFMLVAVPHAFLANSLFVPWCLYYVFGSGRLNSLNWRQWLIGSIVGVLILTTYFYPFILLGFVILVVGIATVWQSRWRRLTVANWKSTLAVLVGVGLFSAWYWLPNVLAVVKLGMDRSRGDWYHASSDGLGFPFVEWNWIGLIGLLSILYLLRRRLSVVRQLLLLLASAIAFFGVGSFLGATDISLNLTKDREFVWAIMTPAIGLALYTLIGKLRRRKYGKVGEVVLIAAFLLVCARGMTRMAHDSYVEKARATTVPDFGLTRSEMSEMADKVLLASNEECFAFLPAKAFINVNEHFAHPASRFALRYDFLVHLCRLRDPELFHYALRHNRFDPIDLIMPDRRGDSAALYVALSNYPNGLVLKQINFPAWFLDDTSRYRRVGKSNVYEVRAKDCLDQSTPQITLHDDSWGRLTLLGRVDGQRGNELADKLSGVVGHIDPLSPFWLTRQLVLTDCMVVPDKDSARLIVSLRKNRPLDKPTRIYLHVYDSANPGEMQNHDFDTSVDPSRWAVGDVVTLCRSIPTPSADFGFVLGIFDEDGPTGHPFEGHYAASPQEANGN